MRSQALEKGSSLPSLSCLSGLLSKVLAERTGLWISLSDGAAKFFKEMVRELLELIARRNVLRGRWFGSGEVCVANRSGRRAGWDSGDIVKAEW